MKKRYADRHVGERTQNTELKIISVEDNFFKGDVYFYNFSDVKEKILIPSGDVILLDEDELKEAFDKKEITKEEYNEAYKIAYKLMERLKNNKDKLQEYTDGYLNQFLKEYKKD